MMLVVMRPSEDVASCCHPPPVYEPSSIPAVVGLVIPVPPYAAESEELADTNPEIACRGPVKELAS